MTDIIHMKPDPVREAGKKLERLAEKIINSQSEIRSSAAGMDWSQKDDFVNDVTSWAWKIDSLAYDGNLLARKVAREADEWEAAAAAFGWGAGGYTPFLWDDKDSSAADESDIHQGNIGDCFFMSSIGAIALQHPEIIEKMIHDNGDGTYTVTFYDKNCPHWPFGPCTYTPHEVVVEGNFPNDLSDPDDRVGGSQESWTMILEKAYLKWQTENGINPLLDLQSPAVALSALTGKDCVNYPSSLMSMDTLYESFQRGDAITAGSKWVTDPTRPDFLRPPDDIPEQHVFFVTNVDPISNTVTVQNPWPNRPPITMSFEEYQSHFWLTTTNPVV
ncbi:MAG: hypothetical protein JW748_04750 [Anaerolineales bacterium]|nr:hypothetical protein [Anaerolineales bacterium]